MESGKHSLYHNLAPKITGLETKAYLKHHYAIILLVLILISVTSVLWAGAIVNLLEQLFQVERGRLEWWMWIIVALFFTIIVYALIIHVSKIH